MKKKKWWILVVLVFIIVIVIVAKSINSNRVKEEVRPIVESWVKKNHITIENFSASKNSSGDYTITVYWNGFEKLTQSEMGRIVFSWNSLQSGAYYDLEYIISNGRKYSPVKGVGSKRIFSYADRKDIYSSYSSYSNSSGSSNSSKTATCNYCNGTGKVNGDKCPWCNGSGKTYDNSFNDLLGKSGN